MAGLIPVPSDSTASDGKKVSDFTPPNGNWTLGTLETDFPPGLLNGSIAAIIRQPEPAESLGDAESIIEVNNRWEVDVRWELKGRLVPYICGQWRAKLFLESMGADELDREAKYPVDIPVDQRKDSYHAQFHIGANLLHVEADEGTPFQLTVTVIFMVNDGGTLKPGAIIGYVSFPVIQCFREQVPSPLEGAASSS